MKTCSLPRTIPPRALAGVLALLVAGTGLAAPRRARPAPTPGPGTTEPLPARVDAETALSPVYPVGSKHCHSHDDEGTEGEDFLRRCTGYGGYVLRASGFDYRVNYGIESTDPRRAFTVMLFPLENGPAAAYARADRYDERLVGPIEWRLDAHGRPYAVVARAVFYKNTGSVKTFANPKNKVAEFLLVRGLYDRQDLSVDVPTTRTAFNPVEQARQIAATSQHETKP